LRGNDNEADTERILAAIMALLPAEAARTHIPSPAELALTYPSGHQGEAD
jgi:hypothetical protein